MLVFEESFLLHFFIHSKRTLTEYQSLRAKGSWVLFLIPFLPFDNLLFLSNCQSQVLIWISNPSQHRKTCISIDGNDFESQRERGATHFPTAMFAIRYRVALACVVVVWSWSIFESSSLRNPNRVKMSAVLGLANSRLS